MKLALSFRKAAAFTLVEIALSLAIIGFALVAIIGVLPFGLNVQKENREETIIVQEATYLLDAIRNGARGLDDLTNYVESITNISTAYSVVNGETNVLPGSPDVFGYRYDRASIDADSHPENVITNGMRIIGLLSTPRFIFENNKLTPPMPVPGFFVSNYVFAYVRAMSGPAVEKSPQTNTTVRDLAFRYRLVPEINPYSDWNLGLLTTNQPGLSTNEINARIAAWRLARNEQANLNEVRLLFRWPIDSRLNLANAKQRQVFRTLAGGTLQLTNDAGPDLWLMQPATYQTAQ
jgi:type II secretory pathway pseudopilin PulG